MKKLKNFLKIYEIWIFLLLAPLSSAIFVYGFQMHLIPGRLYIHGRVFLLLFLLIGLVKITRGNSGVKDIFNPMAKWKIPFKWYLFAFFFASSIAFISLCLKAIYLGGDFSVISLNFSVVTTLGFIFNMILFAFVGEVVWVSFAVRQLSKVINPFYASQIVGLVWGLWWIPMVMLNVGVVEDLPIVALLINMMGAAGMCTIVYAQTKSGVCVWVLQIMLNTSVLVFPVSPRASITGYWTFSIVYFLVMLGFMYYYNTVKKNQMMKITSNPN